MAASALAQEPTIDHKPVGCVVAGKFPKLDACFNPADLASARLYFKGGTGTVWYWVNYPTGACGAAILPKPSKKLTELDYYIEIIDKNGNSSRTPDVATTVVPNEGGCKKDIPVAPWLPSASVVVGAPAGAVLPATFAVGAASTGLGAAAIVGGAAVVAGGGAAVIAVSNKSTPTATATNTPTPTATFTATATATNTPTSTATDKPKPTPTPLCAGKPEVTVTLPQPGWSSAGPTLDVAADVVDTAAIQKVDFFIAPQDPASGGPGMPQQLLGTVKAGPPWAGTFSIPCQFGTWFVSAVATNICGFQGSSGVVMGNITCGGFRAAANDSTVAWASRLDVPGAQGSLVVGGAAVPVQTGAATGRTAFKTGGNQIELTLAQAAGQSGLWHFDFQGATWDPRHVVVQQGTIVTLTSQGIVFRLGGKAGERASFSFEAPRP
jgi:hypothetical protein